MNNLFTYIDNLLDLKIERTEKARLFSEFQQQFDLQLTNMENDTSGISKNKMCVFLGNFFVRIQPSENENYEIRVRKNKLRDFVMKKISDFSKPNSKFLIIS